MNYFDFKTFLAMLINKAQKAGQQPQKIAEVLSEASENMGDSFDLTKFMENSSTGSTEIFHERERRRYQLKEQDKIDDDYIDNELIDAAICYLDVGYRSRWPWPNTRFEAGDRRQSLIKAGALIAAEIDRIDRETGKDE